MSELISRQAAIDYFVTNVGFNDEDGYPIEDECELRRIWTDIIEGIPPEPDAISRQAAVEAIGEQPLAWEHGEYEEGLIAKWESDVEAIKNLPPAQPEQHIDADGTLWVTVTDIEQVTRVIVDEEKSKFCRQFYMEEEQRTGHWIPVGIAEAVGGESAQWGSAIAYHKCSECDGQALGDDFEQEVLSKWCPHCGAKMEGDAE